MKLVFLRIDDLVVGGISPLTTHLRDRLPLHHLIVRFLLYYIVSKVVGAKALKIIHQQREGIIDHPLEDYTSIILIP